MQKSLPTRAMREHPDLDQLKRQAKELLEAFIAGQPDAVAEVNAHYRDADRATFALNQAQLALARAYGFDSWPKLKAYVDGVTVTRLAAMARAGDVAQVRAMLKARPELVNMQMSYGDEHRALHFAVMARSTEMTRLLMEHGADARKGIHPHRDATTALTIATERGYGEIVAIIQEEEQRRRNVNIGPETVTSSPDELCEAIGRGDEDRALSMLEADPSLIHSRNRDGWAPLHVAAGELNERLAPYLLDRGADVAQRGKDGRTPLDLAATGRGMRKAGGSERFAIVADLLLRRGAKQTARSAVALGDADWIRARYAEGALENPLDWSTGGLLTLAVIHDRPDILELLLDLGFDPDERVRSSEVEGTRYSQGYPLWQCAALGKLAMAEILLKRGANPNVHVDSSGSAVYSAYSHRQWAMVELLRRHGGVVGADTVAIYRQTELARQMLANEANDTASEGMVEPASSSLAKELLEFGASGGATEIVRMALERIDWPRDDPRWFRILGQPLSFWNHIPWLYAGNPELDRSAYLACFRLILERCDPNLIGGFHRTMLHEVAAMGDHVTEEEGAPFAEALLDAGARTDVRDDLLKSTPLGWACRWGRIEVVKLLLERGADPVEADAEPWATPRAWAEKMGHQAVIALLPDMSTNAVTSHPSSKRQRSRKNKGL